MRKRWGLNHYFKNTQTHPKKKTFCSDAKKQLNRLDVRKAKSTLSAPLPSVVVEKMNRKVAYKQAKAELKKWVPYTTSLKQQETVVFPLDQTNVTSTSI